MTDRVRTSLELDLSAALRELDNLERQLDGLLTPIRIPVEVETDEALNRLRNEIRAADADDINIDVDVDGVQRADSEIDALGRSIDQAGDEVDDLGRKSRRATDDVENIGRRGRSAFSGLTAGVVAFGGALAAIQGARALLGFFNESIGAASDLAESTSKAQVVFGDFFDDIDQFASTAPKALGLANSAALEFTGTFGNLFVALGLSQQAAADLAPEIVQLGADLASFNNLEVTDALEKLRSGLVGEAEPLRSLGVNINEALTKAKALELGLVGVNGELSEAAKVQARYALILEQTGTAQGDFARTSEGIANRQRTLNAEFENFRAAVGEALLPAFEALLDVAPGVLTALENFVPLIEDFATSVGNAVDDSDGFIEFLQEIPTAIGATTDVLGGLSGFIANTFSGLDNLLQLDFAGTLAEWEQAGADFEAVFDNLSVRKIRDSLLTDLRAGTEPIEALATALDTLNASNVDLDTFRAAVERFFRITNVDGADAIRIFQALSTRAGDWAFSADEVRILELAMRDVLGVTGALPPRMDDVVNGLDNLGKGAEDAGNAAATAASGGITQFVDTFQRLNDLAIEDIDFDGLKRQFDSLPDSLDAAAAALRTEEGEIVSDFSVFLDDLDDEIKARAQFAANVDILRALHLDNLVEVFTEAGLPASGALADGIANPAELAAAEAKLEEAARQMAQVEAAAFARDVGEFIAAFDPIEFPIIPVLQPLDTSAFNIPADIAARIGTGTGPGGTTVVQNFYETPEPTTTTERTKQAVNTVRNSVGPF